ncbi:MAG: hypothetical protein ACYDH9_04705 [Limisphaerales bacterium]
MNATAAQLERSIRELPVGEMVALHERLIATIHEREEAKGLEPGFRTEIERRVKGIQAGTAKGVEAFRAVKKM